MAKAYSLDLRPRVWAAWRAGGATQAEVAARFAVSESFLRDLSRRHRESGQLSARPRGGGHAARVDGSVAAAITARVAAANEATIEEHRLALKESGHDLAHSTLGRWLWRLGLTRKKRPSRTTRPRANGSGACAPPTAKRSRPSRPQILSSSTRAGSTGP